LKFPFSLKLGLALSLLSVGVSYVTAWLCVVDAAQVQPGETRLVIGATSAVGSAATQIAKWKGVKVFNVIRPQSDWEFVKENGADEIINIQDTELSSAIAL
jgi:NADPH:quinone reductase and related Zn-dependent oxidoreductases